jgi:predicted dehydrogenase
MRIGQIGLKGHQSVVMRGAQELGDWQVVAVSDNDREAVDKFCKKEPLAKGAEKYHDWRHLIEHTMMDVCCVCDENGMRAEQLIALAERNIHIVTEKPLTTTLEDLERVRSALAKSKSRLTMLLTMRHEPKYPAIRKLIQSGAIGEVCQATTQKSYRVEERDDWQKSRERLGGTIPYIGIHALDMMRWVTGLDYTHVAAFHGNNGTPYLKETEDQASVLCRFTNGASATARLDYLRPSTAATHGDDRLRIAGSEGVIEAGAPYKDFLLITKKEGPREIQAEPTDSFFVEFVKAIREDRPSRIPAEDCFYITELVLKAREAADKKQLVELKTKA